ncbi:hypothetical protein [Pseudorhodoplanes sp.]|uniref:hypothetical protein n=1 Tax=Pseudorhodoplanes sp. TaxID=1934341 RepID=UPI002BFDBF40|nr:hypothetical protein [Pseudorhodoplanes sp.]HWV51459.1 hypothetical protein [Pseudorhodoplanes sp.]
MHFPIYGNYTAAERAAQIRALTFPEILSDPLVRMVMKADGVDPRALENELSDIAATLDDVAAKRSSCPLLAC